MRFRKVLTLTLAGAVLTSSAVMAAEINPTKVTAVRPISAAIETNNPMITDKDAHFVLVINGTGLNPQETKVYLKDNSVTMIPLRDIGEALGYQVTWNETEKSIELHKGAQFIMVKLNEDYYSFGKMAPVKLGTASEITGNKTYIPLKFVTDILKAEVNRDETGVIKITSQDSSVEKAESFSIIGEIKKITKTDKNTKILIEENIPGKKDTQSIVLNVGEKTKLVDPLNDEEISLADLSEGDTIRGFYGPAVTASMPPQGSAEKIEILQGVTVRTGTISEIIENEKTKQILVGDRATGVVLNISDDVRIITEDNQELSFTDLEEGMEIEAYHSLIMTRSLPPISNAKKIIVKVNK